MDVKFTDNRKEVLAQLEAACLRALEKCGLAAERYAKKRCSVDTGLLRNSITHAIGGEPPAISKYKANEKKNGEEKPREGEYSGTAPEDKKGEYSVYIGTNVEYAVYVEMGTGKHASGGRQDPWIYEDAKGNMHLTGGREATPYLKPAVANHAQTYKKIVASELKGEG